MATIDFSSGYRDATKGATLKALQKRQDDQAAATALAMKPREIGSMWQGAAQIGDVISGSIREGRLANQEAAGRARFAELLAGGLAPDEVGEAMGLDPETTMKFQERNWAQEDMLKQRGWSVEDAERRIAAEKEAQAAGFAHDDSTLTKTQTFTANQTEDAQRHALDLAEKADAAQLVLADHNASIDEKKAAQKVLDDQAAAKLVADAKVEADKKAATDASKLATQNAAQSDPIAKIKLAMQPGPNGEPPMMDEATGNAAIQAHLKELEQKATPPGLDEMNRKAADELTKWMNGGQTALASNMSNITKAIESLKPQGSIDEINNKIGMGKTGPLASLIPESWTSVLNPEGTKARDAIRTAVQSSLTHVLGAQFAQVEGEQMLKRAFDMSMSPKENIDRANRIMTQLQQSAKAKDALAKYYFENNYSMKGYTGPTMDQIQADFEAQVNSDDSSSSGAAAPATDAPAAAAAPPSEEDIAETMRANNMTREQVIAELARRQGGG